MSVKPIETKYHGYRCRSRAEARWMIYMDGLGIKYLYEPEGFKLSDGTKYLPDFYLPEQDTFLEIKGVMGELDMHKIKQLVADTSKTVYVGEPDLTFVAYAASDEDGYVFMSDDVSICKCHECGKVYFKEMRGCWDCECCGHYDGDHGFTALINRFDVQHYDGRWYGDKEAQQAYLTAKAARFEHGECG